MKKVFILSGARTPIGSFLGSLKNVPAPQLGALAIKAALERAHLSGPEVDEVFMGQVLTAGVGQAPARQAAIFADLPESVPCTTVNKVCGSGMKTIILGAQSIKASDNQLLVAGGMENMSLAPHLLRSSRTGTRFGQATLEDSMSLDGLFDVYSKRAMGNCAEECVLKYNFSRKEQDEYAKESYTRAQKANREGIFRKEITPVLVSHKREDKLIDQDEGPALANFEKMPKLKPVFEKAGSITAANASTINDGAAALILGDESYQEKAKFEIIAYAGVAQSPTWFTTAPVEAIRQCLAKAQVEIDKVGLFEINEAFACVPLVTMKELKIPHDKVNVFGGAISLGHPIGCSGTRIILSLMNSMEQLDQEYGIAAICIGGGEALSMLIKKI